MRLAALVDLFVTRGRSAHIRSDDGAEFTAYVVQKRRGEVGVKTLDHRDGPWKKGEGQSFYESLRDELLNGEILDSLAEEKALIVAWCGDPYTVRRDSSLGHQPPARETASPPAYPASGSASGFILPADGGGEQDP